MPIQEGGTFAPTQNIVSPGVFTRENDLSGLAQGVANIGGAIVAPFSDGPAFFPATLTDVATLENRFGVADGVYYGPYTAKEYLQQQGIVTVVRVGGLTGYWQKNPLLVYAQPGTWNRGSDAGAITTASFMYLDDTNYTTNINYQQSSSVLISSGSNNTVVGKNNFIGLSGKITVTKATTSEISLFLLNNINGLPYYSTLSSSLATSASLGKVLKITTTDYYNAFTASVQRRNFTVGKTTNYSLANFDFQKSRFSGSISSSATTYSLVFDTNTFGNISGSQNTAPRSSTHPYYSYLTASYTLIGNTVVYGLVFAKCPSSQTTNFSTANYNLAKSTGSYEFRVDNSRISLSGSINVKFGSVAATSLVNAGSTDGTGTLSGSVLYADQQLNIGGIGPILFTKKGAPSNAQYPYYYLTSSVQAQDVSAETAISTAFAESTATSVLFSSSYFNDTSIGYNRDVLNVSSGNVQLLSGSVASVRGSGTCVAGLQLKGVISGNYGKYTGTFTPDGTNSNDPCNPNTSGRQNMILAVLANTQNASAQFSSDYEVYGFNNTTLSQLTSSTFPYKNLINPNENVYNLALRYNFTNPNGSVSSGTYGYYDFSLNENDNNPIEMVVDGCNDTLKHTITHQYFLQYFQRMI